MCQVLYTAPIHRNDLSWFRVCNRIGLGIINTEKYESEDLFFGYCLSYCFCCGCAEENEVPPYRKTSTEAYVMPKPVPLDSEERALIDSKRGRI